MTRISFTATAASLAFVCAAADAFAHAQLEKATPAVGGTVSSASEIRLEFSEGVEPKFSKVSVTGPGGASSGQRLDGRRLVPGLTTAPEQDR